MRAGCMHGQTGAHTLVVSCEAGGMDGWMDIMEGQQVKAGAAVGYPRGGPALTTTVGHMAALGLTGSYCRLRIGH